LACTTWRPALTGYTSVWVYSKPRTKASTTISLNYSQLSIASRPSNHLVIEMRRLRLDRVDKAGRVTLRHRGRLHHIGIGRPYAGWRVAMLIDGLDIEVVGVDGSPLRRLVLDPTKDYQRIP
jgi:hypothetical protein